MTNQRWKVWEEVGAEIYPEDGGVRIALVGFTPGAMEAAHAIVKAHNAAIDAVRAVEPKAEYCPIHPDVQIVVRPSTSVNGGSIGWGCAVCNCLEVERLRGFVSDEERSASIDRARNRSALNRRGES